MFLKDQRVPTEGLPAFWLLAYHVEQPVTPLMTVVRAAATLDTHAGTGEHETARHLQAITSGSTDNAVISTILNCNSDCTQHPAMWTA